MPKAMKKATVVSQFLDVPGQGSWTRGAKVELRAKADDADTPGEYDVLLENKSIVAGHVELDKKPAKKKKEE